MTTDNWEKAKCKDCGYIKTRESDYGTSVCRRAVWCHNPAIGIVDSKDPNNMTTDKAEPAQHIHEIIFVDGEQKGGE